MTSAILELIIFSLPSVLYARAIRRRGATPGEARAAIGWQAGRPVGYALSAAVTVVLLPATYLALHALSAMPVTGSSGLHATYGQASTLTGYLAIAILAIAEEIFFRGLLAGILIRRFGLAAGNTLQALIFLAPHLLLLLVSSALWPLLPVQLLSGWLLGWLRWKTSSIGPCCLSHIAANILSPPPSC